jgi:hypothetical protein
MVFGTVYVVMVVVTAAVVVVTVGLVLKDKVQQARQKVHAGKVIAGLYGVAYFDDIAAVPDGSCESCRRHPATVTVGVVGRPVFWVCQGCTPADGITASPSTITVLPADAVRAGVAAVTS